MPKSQEDYSCLPVLLPPCLCAENAFPVRQDVIITAT